MNTKTRATIEDLYRVEGKAELVNGAIVEMPPRGMSRMEQASVWRSACVRTKNVLDGDAPTLRGRDSM